MALHHQAPQSGCDSSPDGACLYTYIPAINRNTKRILIEEVTIAPTTFVPLKGPHKHPWTSFQPTFVRNSRVPILS